MPSIPRPQRRFSLGGLVPGWLIPGGRKPTTNINPGMNSGGQ
jgi:hypothetical protein